MYNQFKGFCNTPSLFKDNIYGLEVFKLEDVDIDKIDFNNIKIVQKLPLGKRVEFFLDEIFKNSSSYKNILKNIQIIHNKNTLGELDFIIYDNKKNIFIHIELQYKFYIYDDNFANEIDRYIGPNRNDTLVLKLEKLKNKQFPLLFKEEAKPFLKNIDLDNIKQKIIFKANIFVPRYLKNKKLSLINNACISGYFISYKEFLQDNSFKEMQLFLPHRFDWISEAKSNKNWKSYYDIKDEIEFFIKLKASPLVWSKHTQDEEIVIERFFVTWW